MTELTHGIVSNMEVSSKKLTITEEMNGSSNLHFLLVRRSPGNKELSAACHGARGDGLADSGGHHGFRRIFGLPRIGNLDILGGS